MENKNELKKFKVKFFGSKNPKEQIKQIKTEIEAQSRADVEDILRFKYKYSVINGLKIK